MYAREYHTPFISDVLARFIIQHNNPGLSHRQAEDRASDLDIPLRTLPVYHKA